MKGPILIYAGIALSLGAWAHFAQSQVDELLPAHEIRDQLDTATTAYTPDAFPRIDLGSAQSLEDQLAPYMPLAGLGDIGLGELRPLRADALGSRGESVVEVPDASYLMTSAQLRDRRSSDWAYPNFDTRGRHGAPLVPTPRNIIVELVDAVGDPIVATRLQVAQTGRDGSFTPNAYRSIDDPSVWTIGSPLLSPGGSADLELIARTESYVYSIVARLRRAQDSGDIDLGRVTMGRR